MEESEAPSSPKTPIDCREDAGEEEDERLTDTGRDEEEKRWKNWELEPPTDDFCPICFGDFSIPCRANCLHWFCGSCILEYWNYSSASKPCKCPMCSSPITKLIPQERFLHFPGEEEEVRKVIENVRRYNLLYVGGVRGLLQKFVESPVLIKKLIHHMMDSDHLEDYLPEMRFAALLLSFSYSLTRFNFIPTGGLEIFQVFDYIAIGVFTMIRLFGVYKKWKLAQRVRRMAAAQPAFD